MPDQPDDITRLRKASYALEDLPETIALPQRASDEPREPLPVVEATVDVIAFAIMLGVLFLRPDGIAGAIPSERV